MSLRVERSNDDEKKLRGLRVFVVDYLGARDPGFRRDDKKEAGMTQREPG